MKTMFEVLRDMTGDHSSLIYTIRYIWILGTNPYQDREDIKLFYSHLLQFRRELFDIDIDRIKHVADCAGLISLIVHQIEFISSTTSGIIRTKTDDTLNALKSVTACIIDGYMDRFADSLSRIANMRKLEKRENGANND